MDIDKLLADPEYRKRFLAISKILNELSKDIAKTFKKEDVTEIQTVAALIMTVVSEYGFEPDHVLVALLTVLASGFESGVSAYEKVYGKNDPIVN